MSQSFVKIGQTRLRKSNIKQFGIGKEKIPDLPDDSFSFGMIGLVARIGWGAASAVHHKVKHGTFLAQKVATIPKKTHKRYLYITTHQNENHKFYEDQIDIDDCVKRLEGM